MHRAHHRWFVPALWVLLELNSGHGRSVSSRPQTAASLAHCRASTRRGRYPRGQRVRHLHAVASVDVFTSPTGGKLVRTDAAADPLTWRPRSVAVARPGQALVVRDDERGRWPVSVEARLQDAELLVRILTLCNRVLSDVHWRLLGMVATTKIARSGQAVSAALQQLSPQEANQFHREYRDALGRAADHFDLTEAETVLTRWWGIASLRANPLTEEEHDLIRRFHAGEDVGRPSPTAQTTAP